MSMRIRDRDLGWQHLGKTLRGIGSASGVDVGPTGDRDGGLTNGALGLWHEYGHGVPERPHFRPTYDTNLPMYRKAAKRLGLMIMLGQTTTRKALLLLGIKYASDVKATIRAGIAPPLADATVDRKGSSVPLIDTAQYINSIKPEVF